MLGSISSLLLAEWSEYYRLEAEDLAAARLAARASQASTRHRRRGAR
jgi:uncharacterized protein YmfQ (DUF2313 family)